MDSFLTLDPLIFLDFFLEGCLLCSLLLGPLGVVVSVAFNFLKLGGSETVWKSILFMVLMMSVKSITSQYIASKLVGYIMHSYTQLLNRLSMP